MPYCSYKEEWINNVIDTHMKIIVDEIRKNIKNPISIILIGAYARGEGSVLVKGNRVFPLGDYDLIVVTDDNINEKTLEKIEKSASMRIGIKHLSRYHCDEKSFSTISCKENLLIDVTPMKPKQLKSVLPLFRYFEYKQSAKVLWGENALNLIPNFKFEDIPLSDGIRSLFCANCHFVEPFIPSLLKDTNYPENVKENLFYWSIKVMTFCSTALLILARKLEPSYLGRANLFKEIYPEKFPELYKKFPDFPEKVLFFTEQKIKPEVNKIVDPVQTWLDVRRYLLGTMEYYLEKVYNIKHENKRLLIENFYKKFGRRYIAQILEATMIAKFGRKSKILANLLAYPVQIYLNYRFFRRTLNIKRKLNIRSLFSTIPPDSTINATAMSLLYAINDDYSINEKIVEDAIKYQNRIFPVKILEKELIEKKWEKIRDHMSIAYNLHYGQKYL